ncbi:MAG: M23 family metallopeptidase [Candidatus Peribacteraceae bacterium]
MEIRIAIPRPWLLLTIVVFVALWLSGTLRFGLPQKQDDALGGQSAGSVVTDLHASFDRESVKRAVLERKEEILRYELLEIERRIDDASGEEEKEKLRTTRASLLAIIKEKSVVEKMMTESLLAMWEAEGVEFTTEKQNVTELLDWPASPELGISAFFRDEAYKKRFGFDHHAIDIPIAQGTTIIAAAAGVVQVVALNGRGYSSLTIAHENGIETSYGHISKALVKEGARVRRGDAIALSGGEPGTEGAGIFTTGPHLHFVVKSNGLLVDPLQFLPRIKGIHS